MNILERIKAMSEEEISRELYCLVGKSKTTKPVISAAYRRLVYDEALNKWGLRN